MRKFLHKKTISRKKKIQRRNGKKLYLFLPPDGMRACLFPIFPARPTPCPPKSERCAHVFPFPLPFYFFLFLLPPFPPTARPCPTALPFSFSSFVFVFPSLTAPTFLSWAHVGGTTLSCPLGATKFPLSTNKTPFSKILLFHACKLFLSEKIRTDSMTGGKGGIFSPPFPPVTFFMPNARQRFHPHKTGALFHKIRNARAPRTCIRADGRPDRHHARRADAVLLLDRLAQQFRARRIGRIADVIGL